MWCQLLVFGSFVLLLTPPTISAIKCYNCFGVGSDIPGCVEKMSLSKNNNVTSLNDKDGCTILIGAIEKNKKTTYFIKREQTSLINDDTYVKSLGELFKKNNFTLIKTRKLPECRTDFCNDQDFTSEKIIQEAHAYAVRQIRNVPLILCSFIVNYNF